MGMAQEEAAKAARKNKKKKGGEKANTGSENKWLMMAMAGLCGIVALLVLAGVWFYVLPAIGGPAAAMTPPEKFKKFDHLNGEFHVDVPDGDGWEVKDSGSNSDVSPWLKIKKGTVIIEIRQDEAGTAVAALGGTGSAGQDAAATLGIKGVNGPNAADPSESRMIFDRYSNKSQENFKLWEAKSPLPIQTHMGEGRIASVEFQETALSPKRKGVLAAMFPSKAYTILCYCDDGNYAAMRPFFEKIIVSMQPVVNGQLQDMMH